MADAALSRGAQSRAPAFTPDSVITLVEHHAAARDRVRLLERADAAHPDLKEARAAAREAFKLLRAAHPTTLVGTAAFASHMAGLGREPGIDAITGALRTVAVALGVMAARTAPSQKEARDDWTDAELIGAFFASCVAAHVRPIVFDFGNATGKRIQFLGPFDIAAWRPMRELEQRIIARPSAHALVLAILPEALAAKHEPRKWLGPGKYRIAGIERWIWCRLDEERGMVELLARRDRGVLARMPFLAFDRHATHFGLGTRALRAVG